MADQKAQQTTTQMPGPYPFGGEAIWTEFINRYFGDEESGHPGMLDMLEQDQDYKKGLVDQYTGAIDRAQQNTIPATLGGQTFNLYPKGGINLARKKMQAQQGLSPVRPKLSYLDQLGDLSSQMQQWRYGIPTQKQTGSMDRPGPSTMEQVGGWMNVAGGGADLLGSLDSISGGAIGDKLTDWGGQAVDWIGGLF